MRCNCSTYFPEIPEGNHSVGRCGIDVGRVNQLSGKAHPISARTYVQFPTIHPHATYSQTHTYAPMPTYAVRAPQHAVYSTSTNGMLVNVRGGAVLTEARGIFIRNLSYKATVDDLNKLLYTVGIPVDSRLLRDPKTGVFKGVATARFGSKEEAHYAATFLNGREHMGMTLNVRMDTDTTIVGKAEPMIVNGSCSVRYTRIFVGLLSLTHNSTELPRHPLDGLQGLSRLLSATLAARIVVTDRRKVA